MSLLCIPYYKIRYSDSLSVNWSSFCKMSTRCSKHRKQSVRNIMNCTFVLMMLLLQPQLYLSYDTVNVYLSKEF